MIAYYMDENVHGAITKGLRQQGINRHYIDLIP